MFMPSGSHGGSEGSHSSGGSSSGGSSGSYGGGGSGSFHIFTADRPMHWHHRSHHYYVSGSNANEFISTLVYALFCFIIAGALIFALSSTLKDIEKIVVDRDYYLDMIENAEKNHSYQKQATITDIFYNEDCGKWYITYAIPYTEEWGTTIREFELSGYTYSIYTREQVKQFEIGQQITVACNSQTVTSRTDSITLDYKNYPLSADGEYMQANNSKVGIIIVLCSFAVAGVIFVIIAVVSLKRKVMKSKEPMTPQEVMEADGFNRCAYCGAYSEDKTKCPNCGAVIEIKVNKSEKK